MLLLFSVCRGLTALMAIAIRWGTQGNIREGRQRLAQAEVGLPPSEELEAPAQGDTGEKRGGWGRTPTVPEEWNQLKRTRKLNAQWDTPLWPFAAQR
jgi:hypothetical protein